MATTTTTTTTKEVHTDLSPFIKSYTDGTIERLMGSPYVPPSPEDPITGISSKDTTISPAVSARIYLPKLAGIRTREKLLPIFVYYHGGGFCIESAFTFFQHRFLNILSAAAGALVISVEYRLAPEHHLPAAYEDSWEALKWVCSHGRANVDETHTEKDDWLTNHGDLNRVFIGGDSAGGNIAHNMALRASSEPHVKIMGLILLHPYFWGSEPKVNIEQSVAYKLWMFVYPWAPGGIDNPLINPWADGAPVLSGLGCSKLMVCVAEKDPLMGRGLVYVEEVNKSGWKGEVEVVEIEGEGHCFQLLDPETLKAKELINRLAAFISH